MDLRHARRQTYSLAGQKFFWLRGRHRHLIQMAVLDDQAGIYAPFIPRRGGRRHVGWFVIGPVNRGWVDFRGFNCRSSNALTKLYGGRWAVCCV